MRPNKQFRAWATRIYGSWGAYRASQPSRQWYQTARGLWASRPR